MPAVINSEYSMNLEIQNVEVVTVEQPIQYQFIVDSDLVHVGGGGGLLDY